jgi:hypothetical protein
MNSRFLVNAFLLLFTISITTTSAAIPRLIAYQGILTDNAGNPLADGVQKVLFELYDDTTAAAVKVWGDENLDVTTRQGYFAVILGSKTPLNVAFDKQYWMQTTVNAKQLSPRVPFTASAYALRADTADVAKSIPDSTITGVDINRNSDLSVATLRTSGNIGIGNSLSNVKLQVGSGSSYKGKDFADGILVSGGTGNRWIGTEVNGLTGYFGIVSDYEKPFAKFDGYDYTSNKPINVGIATNGGNVGIGTAKPQAQLDVRGNIVGTNPNGDIMTGLTYTGANDGVIYANDNTGKTSVVVNTRGNSYLNGGNVGIGTTTPKFPLTTNQGGTIATTILRLQNSYLDQGSYGIQLAGIDNGINGHNLHIQARNTLSGAFYDIAEFHNNGELSISGTISASNGAWSSSDRRFKLNILPIDTALSLINSINGVRYDWDRKSFPERNFSDTRQIGLIAQDVEKVLPELVHTDSDGYKSLSYDKLTAVLVEAVKELKVENEKLRARVKALEDH